MKARAGRETSCSLNIEMEMNRRKRCVLLLFTFFIVVNSAKGQDAFVSKADRGWDTTSLPLAIPRHTVYLIGDAGAHDTSKISPVLDLLGQRLNRNSKHESVVFLGDNIYPRGLPDSLDEGYIEAVLSLERQLEVVKGIAGNVFVVPGNHDWKRGRKEGHHRILNQQEYVNNYLKKRTFYPENGCPGPVSISLEEGIVLVIIDTQWWLQQHFKPTTDEGCEVSNEQEFAQLFKETVAEHEGKQLLVVGHHPLKSNGAHGGNFQLKDHLFPLTALSERLYLPLPIIGSIYPLYRKNVGSIQDISHLVYREMKDSLLSGLGQHAGVVYASGHDHHLEYRENENNVHLVISGSGSKTTHVKRNRKASFAHSHRGLVCIRYYENGESWMEILEPNGTADGEVVFRKQLTAAQISVVKDQLLHLPATHFFNYSDSSLLFPGFSVYNTKSLNRFMLGEHYRKSWTTPIKVRLIDLKREHGGLRILKRGGGFQTVSVRLENDDGQQFVLRSIQKDPQTVIPSVFRQTFARRILQDQISASHPYGALAIPRLAEAVGIYHTNPHLVFIPNESYLGRYQKAIGNSLALYEERPKGDMSHAAHFGNSTKIMSTPDVLEKIRKNHRHHIDQHFVIRSRIFDIFVNDWDRHEDQWRWARFEKDGEKYYRPIPRDRDQVFYRFDGLVPTIANRKWAIRKFQHFEANTRDVAGLGFNARHFDRFFTNEMSLQDWRETAKTLQEKLTDEVIERAVRDLPEEIFENDGEFIITTLKQRRSNLVKMAEEHYRFLNKIVQLSLTNDDDYVEIFRLNNDTTWVMVYERKKGGNKGNLTYSRAFLTSETKEIRIHGLDGDDQFMLKGKVNKGIKIRIKGGSGKEIIDNQSRVTGLRKKFVYYDRKSKTAFKSINGDTKLELTKGKEAYHYEPRWFRYNVTAPLLDVGINPDDGLFFGGGVSIKRHGFEKEPYASMQKIYGAYAPSTGSFNLHYNGDFIHVYRKLDLEIDVKSLVPNYRSNFYGMGNDTKAVLSDDDFYRIRYEENKAIVALKRRFGDYFQLKIGPFFTNYEVEKTKDRLISSQLLGLFERQFEQTYYTGGIFAANLDKRDNKVFTKTGIQWANEVNYYSPLTKKNNAFFKVKSDLRLYYTLFLPFEATIANRFGGERIMLPEPNSTFAYDGTDFPFFLGAVVGGDNRISSSAGNLRGAPRGRYTGKSSMYSNNDIRIPLITMRNTRITGKLGILGFWDAGRVWFVIDSGSNWHQSYGGGVWYTPFHLIALSVTYAISEDEDNFFYLNTGFAF
jgi:predicted phosphodiesterase